MEYYSQCLFYALDTWASPKAGYIKFGRSTHWCIPHVLHEDRQGVTTHFAPSSDLKQPWYSLKGFKGKVYVGDKDVLNREPMTLACMFIGTVFLLVLGGVWAIKRIIRNIYDTSRKR